MAKKTPEKEIIPKLVLSEDEVNSLEQVQADDKLIKKHAPKREKETLANEKKVEEIRSELDRINSLPKDDPEYLALRRQRRQK